MSRNDKGHEKPFSPWIGGSTFEHFVDWADWAGWPRKTWGAAGRNPYHARERTWH